MFFKKLFSKKAREKLEKYQEAVTFAEEGDIKGANQLLQEKSSSNTISPKLLVLSESSNFSEKMMDYSLDMAKRMGYKILACNSAPIKNDTPFNQELKQNLEKSFLEESKRSFARFQEKAKELGIEIEHKVFLLAKEKALEILSQENPIEFVISDIDREYTTNAEQAEERLCVYSLC